VKHSYNKEEMALLSYTKTESSCVADSVYVYSKVV